MTVEVQVGREGTSNPDSQRVSEMFYEMKSVSLPYISGQRNVVRGKMWWVGLLSKCVSTGIFSMNVPLYMICMAFYINMREGMPEYEEN